MPLEHSIASPSPDEIARLKALRDLAILDTAAEASFDELTHSAALVCQAPMALISLVDERRQWFKSRIGVEAAETSRDVAFCAHAIAQPDQLLEVPDATQDPRFADNPLVVGDFGLRFYAGVPLVDDNGHALGTLCVIDRCARTLEPWQRQVLNHLAHQVMRLFSARAAARRLAEVEASGKTAQRRETPVGSVRVQADGRVEINHEAADMIGRPASDLPDLTTWFARVFGERAAQARRLYDEDRAAGFPQARQVMVHRPDGSSREIEFTGIHNAQGELWLLRDVTSSADAEERFRVLFDRSSDAHLLFDESGIIDCNHAAVAMLHGQDKQALLGLHPARLSPEFQPDGRRSDEKCVEMDALARTRGHHRFEWTHRRLDGEDFPAEVTLTPVSVSGHPVLLVVWHDLTERKKSEESERQRQRRWLLALEASGDGVWDWDLDRNHVFFSPRWKSMLGYADDEIGDTLDEWDKRVHPDDKDRTYQDVRRHLSGESAQYVNEHRVLCRDGTWKWILDRGMVVERFPDGRPRRMIGTHSDLTERRKIQEELRLEQERFRVMTEASPIGIYTTDIHGKATYLNERWCSITGMPAKQAMNDGWKQALDPADRERVLDLWNQSVENAKPFDAEYRFRRPDGTQVWVHGMATAMRVEGRVVGYVSSITDITERHAAEERLRDSVDRFDLVTSGAAIGIWETRFDPQRWKEQIKPELPFYWSRRLTEALGYTPEEFPDCLEPWLNAMHPDDRTRTLGAVHDCLAYGVPYNVEYRLLHKNGEFNWYHATGEAERDASGRPVRMAGSMADISARKRDEDLLAQARSQLLDAIGSIDAGFAMYDADDHLVICNQRFGDLYGIPGQCLMPGTPYVELLSTLVQIGAVHGMAQDPHTWVAERLASHRTPGPDQEFLLAGRWVRLSERRTANGGIVSLHTDVTALKHAAEEMRAARDMAEGAARAKADFLATMSHELRTPMNGVIGMSSLLLDTGLSEQQREFADTVRLCGEQLLALINDILDFSKIEAGSLVLERIPYSPRKLAEDCVTLVAEQAQRKGLEMVCLIAADVPQRLLGDPTRLRQILLNLLGNAVKFTERGEVVLSVTAVATADGRPGIELAVRDTGVGIPREARQRLFKPFSQADSSTTRKYGGTGLGLVICQRLVQLMGGIIDLESEPGSGSVFYCRVPLDIAPDTTEEPPPVELAGRQVAVVGGSQAARRSLREQFIGWGMTYVDLDTASAGLGIFGTPPALVVIDHDQPGGGLTLAAKLRQNPALRTVPQILLVGAGHRGMAAAAKEAGIAGFLTKPVRHQSLFDCLLVVLQQRSPEIKAVRPPELVTKHKLDEDRDCRRVLVVEDNPVNRQVAVIMLTKFGCRCDVATNGQEAIDATAKQTYEVVFMDCQMPIKDGFVATKEIRQREGDERKLRIIALTANALQGDRERCLAAGMDDYITKPIKPADLEAALQRTDQRRPAVKASAAPLVAEGEILDASALQCLLDATDPETVTAVAEMFETDALAALAELQTAAKARDAVTLGRTAHRLKGSSGTLGLRRIQSICERLERYGRNKDLTQVDATVAALEQAVHQGLPILRQHPLNTRPKK